MHSTPHNVSLESSSLAQCAGKYVLLAFVCAVATAAHAQTDSLNARAVRVLHTESLTLEWSDSVADVATNTDRKQAAAATNTSARTLRFDAFGQRFNATLTGNDKWTQAAKARGSNARPFRGELSGKRGSWVRITQVGAATHGLMWDGEQLYAIAPASEVSGTTNTATSVIFRLADTVTDVSEEFCSAHASADSGAALYDALLSDAQESRKSLAAAGPEAIEAQQQLQLSVLFDASYRAQYTNDAAAIDAVIVRLNNVDGIFSSQFGVEIAAASIEPAEQNGAQALSDALEADVLLRSLSSRRSQTPQLSNTGVTHLFTGRDLKGSTVGLAYIDSVCDGTYGAALSESRARGAWFDSLVVAHELGHSFGSLHDGEGVCASTPKNYLMAPYIVGSDLFSACSSAVVEQNVHTASCLTPIARADVSITPNLGSNAHVVSTEFERAITITNVGGSAAQQVAIEMTLPSAVTVVEAALQGGYGSNCTYGAGVVSCTLPMLAANSSVTVLLQLISEEVGAYDWQAMVSAVSDADFTNNSGNGSIVIQSQPAVATVNAAPTTTNAPAQAAASEGGGGSFASWQLLVLMLLGALRAQRRQFARALAQHCLNPLR
jgi:hypothetical protein